MTKGLRQGGCACGALRYSLRDEPMITHGCHCSCCQRETGSALAVNMMYERDRVELVGLVEEVLTRSESGKGQRILRCLTCRVAVSSHYAGSGDAIHFIRAGTLDDRSGVAPDVHIFTSSKQDWMILPQGVPAFDEYYLPKDFWSEDTLGRWRKATGR